MACASIFSRRKIPARFDDANLRGRYLETTELAASYTRFLDTLNGLRRVEEIRTFRALDYDAKKQRILALDGRSRAPASRTAQASVELTNGKLIPWFRDRARNPDRDGGPPGSKPCESP